MTERNYTKSQNEWVGKVVSVADPDMDGRVQVRIFGQHDNTTNIPDNMCPWAKPEQDVTSAAHNKMGGTPVGIVVGSIIHGYYKDTDMQVLVYVGTVAKAGDYPQSSTSTQNGQPFLIPGTNSSPLGGRIKNNAFITRKGRNIVSDDKTGTQGPQEQKDSDGVDIVAQAKAATKYATMPTVASQSNPTGSILQQITQVDPKNLNAVLPQAVMAYQQIKNLSALGTTGGLNGVLGQTLGAAMSAIGAPSVLSAMAQSFTAGSLSSTASAALSTAVQALGSGSTISSLSSTIQSVVNQSLPALTSGLASLVHNNGLTSNAFNGLMDQFFSEIQNNGSQATLGTSPANILNEIETLIPQVAGALNSVLSGHLPQSVLNTGLITQALQAFSVGQAFLKMPSSGKKALAILATSSVAQQALGSIPGVSQGVASAISAIL